MVWAEEPVDAYLAALQDRGYFDVAIRYLDRMANSQLAPDGFKDDVAYKSGMLMVTAARSTKNAQLRQDRLNQAQQSLDKFIKSQPEHPSVSLARNQLGNILVERARGLKSRAEKDPSGGDQLFKQSFDIYEQAHAALVESKKEIGEQYKRLVSMRDKESKSQLNKIKTQYIETYLEIGRVLFEQAKTVKGDENLNKEKLLDAASAFDEVAQKYRSVGASLTATLYQGECYQLLGEQKRSLTYFTELLQNPNNSPPVRILKTKALARAIDSWLATDKKNGPDKSIKTATEWIKTKRGAEDRQSAWLEFRLSLAKAHLEKSKIADGDAQSKRALNDAREIARDLAKRKSDVQAEAQQLLVSMGNGVDPAETEIIDPNKVTTFAEARDAAKASLDRMKLSTTTVSLLSSQLKSVTDPQRRTEIESKIAAAKTEAEAKSAETLALFERADTLATDDNANDLHSVRYYLAYLHYTRKNYRRASVLASHTALNYPESVAAKQCANVAIAARQRLYQELPAEDRDAQTQSITKLGELIISQWPGEPQADSALSTLLDVAISRGDTEKAEQYLSKIPAASAKRATAELRYGQTLWREYLIGVIAKQKGEGTKSDAQMNDLKTRAQEVLAKGVERSVGQQPNESAIRGALSLAKIYVDAGKPSDALDLLAMDGIGSLSLVQSHSPWSKKIPGLAIDAYSTAIRAHVATAASSGDSQASISAAQDMLTALQNDLKNQPNGEKKMIGIYVGLARDLERQLAIAPPSSKDALSKGFESFMEKAAEGTSDVAILNWVADTFYGMGNGLIEGTKRSPEAQRYFMKARSAYARVLDAVKSDSKLPASRMQQIQVRQAMTLRQLGKFEESLEILAELLRENRFLNIQIEAAKTLQRWGDSGNADAFKEAIVGSHPGNNGRNLIWGWARIAKLVSKSDKSRDSFHEARYNTALCRYKLAKSLSGAEQTTTYKRAKSDITATQQLYDLGDASQRKRYESLLRTIQKNLGEPATGFAK